MPRILIVSDDEIGPVMAGPGMRFRAFADYLCQIADVTMAVPHEPTWQPENWKIVAYTRYGDELDRLVDDHEVILCKGLAQFHFPSLVRTDRILVCDMYDPFMFENLEAHADSTDEQAAYWYQQNLDIVLKQLARGDYFICANERQRDLWMGMLASLGRINHAVYAQDKTLRKLIDVVPFGITPEPPTHAANVIKGVWPGVKADDKVLLWGGGVWSWLDIETPLQGMALLAEKRPDIKFCFLGKARPAGSWYTSAESFAEMDKSAEAIAERLGVLGKNVFFNEQWVPLDERGAYLLEADVGIITHPLSLETHYSARTRALDYLWAGLPILTTTGDIVAEWVDLYDLGATILPHDAQAFADAVERILAQPRSAYAPRMQPLVERLVWPRAVEPLMSFCRNPEAAADRASLEWADLQKKLDSSLTQREEVIRDLQAAIRARDLEIDERKSWVRRLEASLEYREEVIRTRESEIEERKAWQKELEEAIHSRDTEIEERKAWTAHLESALEEAKAWIVQLEEGIRYRDGVITAREHEIEERKQWQTTLEEGIHSRDEELAWRRTRMDEQAELLRRYEARFGKLNAALDRVTKTLKKEEGK